MSSKIYLVVTPFFPSPTRWQGAYCFDFVCALRRELEVGGGEWKTLVFVPGEGEDYEYQGVKVYRFPTKQLPTGLFPHLFDNWKQRSFLTKLKEVLTSIDQPSTFNLQPQISTSVKICHAHTRDCVIYPYAIKKLNPSCLTLMHHHDPGSVGLRNGRFHRFWLQRWSILSAVRKYYEAIDCHVFISKVVENSFRAFPDTSWTQYEDYRECGRGFSWMKPFAIKRSVILHNGVDTAIFRPAEKTVDNSIVHLFSPPPPKVFTIGCVANLEDWKDPLTLVKACVLVQKKLSAIQLQTTANDNLHCPPAFSTYSQKLPSSLKLICVGSGSDVSEMKRLAAADGLNLEIRSEVDHTQLPAFYHELDLFVLPSYFEGFGCVFTEAYASGVPFITCEGQGMDDLVADNERSLWFSRSRDPKDLAEKILHYIQNRPQQHLKGEIGINALVADFCKQLGVLS